MGFADKQRRALGRSVPASKVRLRTSNGKDLAYVEGWYALTQANRVFGYDGWDRETLDVRCLQAKEVRGRYRCVYSARVRITVRAGASLVVRDGHGTGEADANSPGEAHDLALKAAETDATKRALTTFGKAFGLALYSDADRRRRKSRAQEVANGSHGPATGSFGTGREDGGSTLEPAPVPLSGAGQAGQNPSRRTDGQTGPQPRAGIGSSVLKTSVRSSAEPERLRDKRHLRHVASQPCLLCSAKPADAHHLGFVQPRGLGLKSGDQFTVPLCRRHHRMLHDSGNEAAWWHDMGIDAVEAAHQLWCETTQHHS